MRPLAHFLAAHFVQSGCVSPTTAYFLMPALTPERETGAPGGIRTHDLRPRLILYMADVYPCMKCRMLAGASSSFSTAEQQLPLRRITAVPY
jgi:hypothetical protein